MIYRGFNVKVREAMSAGIILVAVTAIGCGGASGTNSTSGGTGPSGGGQTANVGMAQITYTGKPKPMVSGTAGPVSFYGEAGASFTSLTIDPAPNLASTSLLYTRSLAIGYRAFNVPAGGQGTQTAIAHSNYSVEPSCSQTGLIAYTTIANDTFEVVVSDLDGSHSRVALTGIDALASVSPNGATIAFLNVNNGNIYTVSSAGGTATEIYSGGNASSVAPVWSPNGTQIAFGAPDPSNTYVDVYTMAATGGATTNVTPPGDNGVMLPWSWSPDGSNIACGFVPNGSPTSEVVLANVNGGDSANLTPSGYSDFCPCISPDNLHLAFYRTSAGGASPGIYESDLSEENPQLLFADPTATGQTGPVVSLAWSFFQGNEKFVGSGSTLSDAAVSGLLLTQNGSFFSSLMVFAAATPSTATITTETTGSNGAPSIFKLAANTINIISYTNVYYGTETFLPLSGTAAALVTLDGATGLIDFVAPGAFTRKQPLTSAGGHSTLVYSGKFTGIYDGTGKNLAPTGASTLEIDAMTGKLVSFK